MPKNTSRMKFLAGPALLLCTEVILVLLAMTGHHVPNPVLFFSLAIVLSTSFGGYASGGMSVALSFIFLLYYWSVPGKPFLYTARDVYRLILFLVTMPTMVFLVGMLEKKNRMRLREIEKKTKELLQSEQRLQRAELVAEMGNWETNLTDGSLYTSEGANRIYGLSGQRCTLFEVQHIPLRQYRPMLDTALKNLVEHGADYNVTFKIRRKSDDTIIDINSRATYDPTEHKIFGTIQDVTAQKAVEADLIESRKKAELANKAKSEFLANMSHEIRTPLNGILGMLQTLEDTSLSREQQQFVDCAIRAARRLTQLLNDILDLSRIESGKIQITPVLFKLDDLVASIEEIFSFAAQEKKLSLSFALAPGIPNELIGDEIRIRQVLFNLIGNAIKFTHVGGVTVSIEPIRIAPRQVRLLFTVSDTGIGISETIITHLCEPFIQAHPVPILPTQGVGLGLSIVHKLTALMDGAITIESQEGHGTTAYFSLPLGLPAPTAADEQAMPCAQQTSPPTGHLHILLAEDDQISALACRRLLEKMGHTVAVAPNGRQAVDRFAREAFDLVFMDIQMPELDGLQATRKIRNEAAHGDKAKTPIIAMTAHAMAGDADRFLAAGMNGYIAKPVEKRILEKTIATLMPPPKKGDPPATS